MPKEEHTSSDRSFDDLARAVAEGSLSRRRALKLFAGTAIAALIPSRALADDDCVHICHVPFDRQTGRCFFGQRENRCVPRSRLDEHRNHPCDCLHTRCRNCTRPTTTSTTTSTSTTTPTTTTSTTTCSGLPNGTSCSTSSDCCSGNCSNGFCCASGYVGLSNGTCAKPCTNGLVDCPSCSDSCANAAPGGDFCSNSAAFPRTPCSDHSDCPQGQFCRGSGSGDRCDVAC